ncbi:MAG: DNA topoisomerase VI subunit B [Phycisphaerae bacterium]|nr:DNA topoisomerase VI subunit B [Phycisphaerae bacterium]
MAKAQREISVSEFFAKNRHLLGFDNKRKALLTTVKEAVDNSLDACEEAGILPDLEVSIAQVDEDRFRVRVRDNGPGIVKQQIPNVFGKLLYGSKFHRLKMSRGQQGIGISAAGMYGLLTTGKSVRITSRTGARKEAHYYEIQIDTRKNQPTIVEDRTVDVDWPHGTELEIELVASYNKGRQSVDEYVELTAIANPHAHIHYRPPTGDPVDFPRASNELPPPTHAIKPHPYGIELGVLIKMLHDTKSHWLSGFLSSEFSRVSARTGEEICARAKLNPRAHPRRIARQEAETLYKALQAAKLMAPPTNCLAPMGPKQILAGLLKGVQAEFYTAATRDPAVYRGNPFQIEVGLAYGGDLGPEAAGETDSGANGSAGRSESVSSRVIRFANRVPLLYQQSACCIFKSVIDTDWRRYGLSQPGGGLPQAPLLIMVHMASVWVPFTSESKEAIADYDEIRKEIKLALQECGRKLQAYVNRRKRQKFEGERRNIFERYIGEVVTACAALKRVNQDDLRRNLLKLAQSVTARADETLDEEGKVVAAGGKPARGRSRKPGKRGAKSAESLAPASEYGENTVVVERQPAPPESLLQ